MNKAVLVPVKRIKDAIVARCRECGHVYDDSAPWGLAKSMGLHSHKLADGRWEHHGDRKFFDLFTPGIDTGDQKE